MSDLMSGLISFFEQVFAFFLFSVPWNKVFVILALLIALLGAMLFLLTIIVIGRNSDD